MRDGPPPQVPGRAQGRCCVGVATSAPVVLGPIGHRDCCVQPPAFRRMIGMAVTAGHRQAPTGQSQQRPPGQVREPVMAEKRGLCRVGLTHADTLPGKY